MFKVIVERPRWGVSLATAPKVKRSREPDRKQIGVKRHAAVDGQFRKGLNENLAPLIRFLRSRRGRRWDDVFSEICAQLDTGSTVKMHVRQHLDDFVMRPVRGRYGGWIWQGRKLTPELMGWRRHRHFFVDPADGILKDAGLLRAMVEAGQ
jgi:hypothetical protein